MSTNKEHMSNIRVHTTNVRVHMTKYGNIILYSLYTNTYKCKGATYDDRRVINMKCTIFHISFSHVHLAYSSCARSTNSSQNLAVLQK